MERKEREKGGWRVGLHQEGGDTTHVPGRLYHVPPDKVD